MNDPCGYYAVLHSHDLLQFWNEKYNNQHQWYQLRRSGRRYIP